MRHPHAVISILIPLLLAPLTLAQRGDWQAVKNLAPGTRISVKARGVFAQSLCDFERATDNQLFCERAWRSRSFASPESVYDRKMVGEVRLEHTDRLNAATGAVVGGGVGAAIGATAGNGSLTRGGGALLLGGIGALVGGTFARDFPVKHSKVIYRQ